MGGEGVGEGRGGEGRGGRGTYLFLYCVDAHLV